MLTPMIVQYLVGLCCLHHDPEVVDITVGDMVLDSAAGKSRDVDVTVTIRNKDGGVEAFKACEVKHEGKPLDVGTIEQLCLKLADMPSVTHRSVVSTSGYTDGARAKAYAHSVDLYFLKPWNTPIGKDFPDFKDIGTPEEFLLSFESSLLYWIDARISPIVPEGPSSFDFGDLTPILTSSGECHGEFENMRKFSDAILYRSTGILFSLDPAQTVLRTFPYGMTSKDVDFNAGPAWPHSHTMDVHQDQVYLKLGEKGVCQIKSVTVSGLLQWRRRKRSPEFFVLERVPDGSIFAGAAIADFGADDGRMLAMIFPHQGRTLGIHQFKLSEKHKNMIRGLKIPMPSSS